MTIDDIRRERQERRRVTGSKAAPTSTDEPQTIDDIRAARRDRRDRIIPSKEQL